MCEAVAQKIHVDMEPGDRLEVSGTATITVGSKSGRRTRVMVEAGAEVTIDHQKTPRQPVSPFRGG